MKLSDRGIEYESEPSTLKAIEGKIGGLYRGQNWRFNYVRHIPQPPPGQNLKYCGVAYRTGQVAGGKSIEVSQPAKGIPPRIFSTRNQLEVLNELEASHQRSIQRSLEHRLAVARAKNDKTLIRLLEAESQQMALPL